jgi:hypothetical protein
MPLHYIPPNISKAIKTIFTLLAKDNIKLYTIGKGKDKINHRIIVS